MAMAVGMVMAAGMAMAVAEFADPAMVRRPTVEGSCGVGGLSIARCCRLWRLLAMVMQGGQPDSAPLGPDLARPQSEVGWCGVRSSCSWHLGASAMDALVNRVSEVKTLLRFWC
uniref:Secreted protein n=1 Tax=Oryza rufipogon TaxID=4529 RepID=A0A0E0PMV7_ORYRU